MKEVEEMSEKSNTITGQMTINLPGVIKTLGENLYSDPSVSIRELIQNANDTCVVRQAEDPSVPNSEIHIRFDAWKRLLVIEDNGAGMKEEEVKQFLTVVGNSNTKNVRTRLEEMGQNDMAQRLIGRFGLGLLSAFIIGDKVEFQTLSYKEGAEPVWWTCDGEQEYTMGPTEKETIGTIVTVHVNPKHVGLIREEKLTELIHLYADFLQIPIYLDPMPNPVNVIAAPWDQQAAQAEYHQFVADRYPDDAILDVIPLEIDEDDGKFKVNGVLFIPKQPYFIVREHGDVIVYVRRMFVCKDERAILPEWAKFVKGIVSSPNLRETTSREAILLDENLERVQKVLGQAILDYLTRISDENPRLFKEIVTNHNLVIKAWAIVSDELFDRIKDIVLFQTDAGLINLQRYFEMSRYSKAANGTDGKKRYIFYFTTPGGAGQHAVLFQAKGLRVIDASQFPNDGFLQKYADRHDNVILRRLDVSGGFIFEDLERREHKWVDLEDVYAERRIDAKVVRFAPDDIPATLIYPEAEPATDQVERLINDPDLSPSLKSLVRQMWEDREKQRKGQLSAGGVLYINANNPVIQKLVDLDVHDYEMQDVLTAIYNNALMLSAHGSKMAVTPESAKRIFDANNRTIAALMNKIDELRDLKAQQLTTDTLITEAETAAVVEAPSTTSTEKTEPQQIVLRDDVEQTAHITCFVALPFTEEYDIVLEALKDVLEASPYFWEVARADKRYFANDVANNVACWIARSQCYVADVSENNGNVMLESGLMYWGYPERPLFFLKRKNSPEPPIDISTRLYIEYPWEDPPDQADIADAIKTGFEKFEEEIEKVQGKYHYLTARAMREDWITSQLAQAVSNEYETVEDFLAEDAQTVSRKVGTVGRQGIIQDLQEHLRELCSLS